MRKNQTTMKSTDTSDRQYFDGHKPPIVESWRHPAGGKIPLSEYSKGPLSKLDISPEVHRTPAKEGA